MPPWAVSTITGIGPLHLLELGEDGHAVDVGHDEIEDDQRGGLAVARPQEVERRGAAVDRDGLVPDPLDRRRQQPPLHRIVIDNENGRGHDACPS